MGIDRKEVRYFARRRGGEGRMEDGPYRSGIDFEKIACCLDCRLTIQSISHQASYQSRYQSGVLATFYLYSSNYQSVSYKISEANLFLNLVLIILARQ